MIIIQDTREKLPWSFISYEGCKEQKIKSLSEGDYTLSDYTNLIAIERKRTVNEIANNLGKKYVQFKKELEKLKKYRFKYVICEFLQAEVAIYPTGLPPFIKKKIKIGGKFLLKRIEEVVNNYEIEFVYCNNRYDAQDKAYELITKAKYIYDQEK
jgi:hypothetical protein